LKNGQIGTIKFLMEHLGIDPSDDDNYAIRWASLNDHTEIVKLLLKDPRVTLN
jgi:ankyrin repeat protein